MSILVDKTTRILVLGITGREAVSFTRDTLDYGGKVVAGVTPGRGGRDVHGVPVYDTVKAALADHAIDAVVVAVPPPAVRDAAFECVTYGIPLMVIVTERVPRMDVAQVVEFARANGTRIIGPNSMGLISPGKTKVGSVGGPAVDAARSFVPGTTGIMSRSGGMTTELASLLAQNDLGVSTAISVGGDPIIGSTFADLLPLFEADPGTEAVVTFSEPGGGMDAALAEQVAAKGTRLRIVSFIAGNFMAEMPGVRFGHAGSLVRRHEDSAEAKAALLRAAGITVAEHLADVPKLVRGG